MIKLKRRINPAVKLRIKTEKENTTVNQYHVLLVEDEADILEYNKKQLEERGYRVTALEQAGPAEKIVEEDEPDIMVLDIMLPDGSGIDLCRKIRESFTGPVIFLTSLGESSQVVSGLKAGGDDYIIKPCRIEELAARIEAHLRRVERFQSGEVKTGSPHLTLNTKTQRAYVDGKDMLLKPKEFLLLYTLVKHRGRYLTADELYAQIWDMNSNDDVRTIWVHISRLRKKLKTQDGKQFADIECEKFKGYRLVLTDFKE